MTQKPNSKPATALSDGSIRATIWKNQGEKGPFYSVRITRTYTDEKDNYHDSDSFSGSELLRVARMAQLAYDHTLALRAEDNNKGGAQ
ncbi:MAG: hypothetical protein ACIAQF_06890 [Phycisphaerales bacterium JB065]